VIDGSGRSARFSGFAARRDPASGVVVVQVERSDLGPAPRAAPRRSKPARKTVPPSNPLGSFLPVR
jgi:hypothetical protein